MASNTQKLKETDAFGSLLENQKVEYSRPLELLNKFYTSCMTCGDRIQVAMFFKYNRANLFAGRTDVP